MLFGDESHIAIPLSLKGCIGELDLTVGGERFEGNTKDLSAFGVDFNDFVTVCCESQNGRYRIFINQKLAYEGPDKHMNHPGRIVGARIVFQGTGEIRRFDLRGL